VKLFFDLFNYANGFSTSADKDTIRIERLDGEINKFIKVSDVNNLSSIKPMAGDRLNVRAYERKSVTIVGAINTPGTYIIAKGETLSSLITKAEGYKDDAYPFAGILINQKTLSINEEAVEKLYTSFVQKLISKGDSLFASESLPFILEELKKSTISGRVMAEFDIDIIKASPQLDTTLSDGDEVFIPTTTQQVFIYGEVNNPGALRYKAGESINDYLVTTGGHLESADTNNIFVIHPNGEINRVARTRLSFLNNRTNNIPIYPGSVIYIPRMVSKRDPALVASIWAPIVSALALSLTSLSVLDNN
jgi:polysaccharide export outer membrane protein